MTDFINVLHGSPLGPDIGFLKDLKIIRDKLDITKVFTEL